MATARGLTIDWRKERANERGPWDFEGGALVCLTNDWLVGSCHAQGEGFMGV